MKRAELEALIMKKAAAEPDFREQLLADPKGTLQSMLDDMKPGFVLPENLNVSINQETPDQIYMTMPHIPEGGATAESGEAVAVVALINTAVCIDVVQVVETSVVTTTSGSVEVNVVVD
jgi:hypothetical protein